MVLPINSHRSPEKLLAEANRLVLAGNTSAAFAKLNGLLAQAPGHVAGNLALADLMKSEGHQDQSLAALRRAAEHAPKNAAVWTRYVYELRALGKKTRAKMAAKVARVTPAQRKELRDIAEGRSATIDDIAQHIRQGNVALAWKVGNERLKHFPTDHRLLNLMGVAALADEDPVRAEPILRRALKIDPAFASARSNLGLSLLRQGHAEAAIRLLEPFGAAPKALPAINVNLASAYLKVGRWQEADELTTRLMTQLPGDVEVLGIRCKALIALGQPGAATRLLEPLVPVKGFMLHDVMAEALGEAQGQEAGLDYLDGLPDQPRETEIRIVSLLAEWGQLDKAAARARRSAGTGRNDPTLFRLIGLFSKWKADDPLIPAMRDGLNAKDIAPLKRGSFGLALAKAMMDVGQHDSAMDALHSGNEILRSLYDYNVASDEALMQRLADLWTAETINTASTGQEQIAPIFIVGLPRSGSTLLETMLSRHPDVESLGESPLAFERASKFRLTTDPAQIADLAADLLPALTPEEGKGVRTDKLLANFMNVGGLAACFPKARFVELRRDYRATCLSIYQADLGLVAHPYSTDLAELGRYTIAYDRLMSHWAEVLGRRFVRVEYAPLVTSAETEFARVLSDLDMEWHEDCLQPENSDRRINTLSVGQARRPIFTSSLDRWKQFETGLAPLIDRLEAAGLV
ncbi:MAG: tetratricopeptide repeat-containing sulfotransferase family protein [Marinosulfonomonas sp.]